MVGQTNQLLILQSNALSNANPKWFMTISKINTWKPRRHSHVRSIPVCAALTTLFSGSPVVERPTSAFYTKNSAFLGSLLSDFGKVSVPNTLLILAKIRSQDGGGVLELFLTGSLKPLPISKDFSPSKSGWFEFFSSSSFLKFSQIETPFLLIFLYLKKGCFYIFSRNFCEVGRSSKDFFWTKWDPCLRIFGEKVTHFGGTSP